MRTEENKNQNGYRKNWTKSSGQNENEWTKGIVNNNNTNNRNKKSSKGKKNIHTNKERRKKNNKQREEMVLHPILYSSILIVVTFWIVVAVLVWFVWCIYWQPITWTDKITKYTHSGCVKKILWVYKMFFLLNSIMAAIF